VTIEAAELQAALAAAGVTVDPIVAPDVPGWISGSELADLANPRITDYVSDVGVRRETDDRSVAAMLGWKGFSYLASMLPLTVWARFDVVPDQHVGANSPSCGPRWARDRVRSAGGA